MRQNDPRNDDPYGPRVVQRADFAKIALSECANMINKTKRLCLDWSICVYWRKSKKECRYFQTAVRRASAKD
jgi:hypothetical protein